MQVELDHERVTNWSPYCDSWARPRRTQEACQFCRGRKIRCDGSHAGCGIYQRRDFICGYHPIDKEPQISRTAVTEDESGFDLNGFDSPTLWDPQYTFPPLFNCPSNVTERSADPVLQIDDPTLFVDIFRLNSVSSNPFSQDFEIQAFAPMAPVGVYVPVENYPFAHITPTQEATTTRHNTLELQELSGREPTALYPFSPDEFLNCPPPEPTTSAFRLHVGSPALASAKRKIRTHAAKYFCLVPGCGRDFTTKQNLKNHHDAHAGLKRHACSACTRPFGLLHGLARHRKTCKVLAARPV